MFILFLQFYLFESYALTPLTQDSQNAVRYTRRRPSTVVSAMLACLLHSP